MLFLILDLKFKSLCLVSSFIGCEQRVAIVEEYNEKSLYPMLLKCYHYLHLVVRSKSEFVEQTMDVDYSLDIFEMVAIISEPSKIIVKRKLLIFKRYQMNVKELFAFLDGGRNLKLCFPHLDFLFNKF
jgi:hypothetical protein